MLENVQVGQEQHPDDDEARKAQKLEEVAVKATATALSADKVEQIAQSLDYVKDAPERHPANAGAPALLIKACSMERRVTERGM